MMLTINGFYSIIIGMERVKEEFRHTVYENVATGDLVYHGNVDEDVMQRRREQLALRLRGIPRRDIIKQLSEKYGVVPGTIDADWARRKDWLLDVVGITDLQTLLATSVESFNISQEVRRAILTDLSDLIKQYASAEDKQKLESLPTLWSILMKVLNDIESSEERKANMLMKLGILKEAPKRLEIDKRTTRVEHKIDWSELMSKLSPEARREFFDRVSDIEYIEVEEGEDE